MTISLDHYRRTGNITADTDTMAITPNGPLIGVVAVVHCGVNTWLDGPIRVTYGGKVMTRLGWVASMSGERSTASVYILDRAVPQGPQDFYVEFDNGSIDRRGGQTWVCGVWMLAGDGDGITVTDVGWIFGGAGNVGANPQANLDSGAATALRIAGLVSGHDSAASHVPLAGFTTDQTEDWGSGTSHIIHETAPSSGDVATGFTAADARGAFWAIAVKDGGYNRLVPYVQYWGPAGYNTDGAENLFTITNLHRAPKAVVVVSSSFFTDPDVIGSITWDGEAMTRLDTINGYSRRSYVHALMNPSWDGSALVAAVPNGNGSGTRYWHHYLFVVDYDGEVIVGSDGSYTGTGQPTFGAESGLHLGIVGGSHGTDVPTNFHANGFLRSDAPLGKPAGKLSAGWDQGNWQTFAFLDSRSDGQFTSVVGGSAPNGNTYSFVDLGFVPEASSRKRPQSIVVM